MVVPDCALGHSGARESANSDVQLHIRESIAPIKCREKWIPGLRKQVGSCRLGHSYLPNSDKPEDRAAHPGRRRREAALSQIAAKTLDAFAGVLEIGGL